MSRILPHPILSLLLLGLWLLLQQSVSPGHLLLGSVIAVFASLAMAALKTEPPKVRRPGKIVKLIVLVTLDIIRSNLAVTWIILSGPQRKHTKGFLVVPLELTNTYGLAILACIVTATPGSAWLEYSAARNAVLIHVMDLVDAKQWSNTLKDRYESLLLEIFE